MIPDVNRFFDEVLVMTEDVTLRQNRLALLQRIVALGSDVADMSKLEDFNFVLQVNERSAGVSE